MMPAWLTRFVAKLLVVTLLFPILSSPAVAGDGTCTFKSRVCVEGPETRTISGYPVTRDCWRYESKYDCISQNYVDDCADLVANGCAQIGSTCVDHVDSDPTKCSLYEQTYQCKVATGATKTITDCGGQTYCVDGTCFDAGYTPDGDFAIAATGLEALREAGNYMDPNSFAIFNGTNTKCRVTLGIFSCCKNNTAGSNQTNADMMTSLGISAVKSFASESVSYLGSRFVYDSLFQSDAPNMLVNGFASLVGDGGSVADMTFTPSASYFGLTVSYGGATAGMTWSTQLGSSGFYVGFDPVSFGISIAIYIIMELLSCDQDEQILGMKKGQNLCVHVGTYCSQKVLGVCVQKKQSHCCFNSRIARLIASNGRAQLGKSWGDPKNPDCGGLTPAELQMVDFSLIDFSEVVGDIVAGAKSSSPAVTRATDKINSYFTTP